MSTNRVKELWQRGEVAHGVWLSIPSTLSCEVLARAGYDYVCLDLQHGQIDDAAAMEMLVAINGTDATPFVRVPANDFAAIGRALDAGAVGIIVPMIESAADAKRAVLACRYPPDGRRSFGPTRASLPFGADYFDEANDLVLCVPMIETKGALEEIDEIASLSGIDGVYVGPNDLSLSLGQAPGSDNDGAYQVAYRDIAERCQAAGIAAGIHANARLAAKHRETGYRMITVSSDTGLLQRGAAKELEQVKQP